MSNIHEILTELVEKAIRNYRTFTEGVHYENMNYDAIKTAAEQIRQQEQERVEKLRKAANISFLGPAYNKQGKALKEHVIVRLEDMQDLEAALKELEAEGD